MKIGVSFRIHCWPHDMGDEDSKYVDRGALCAMYTFFYCLIDSESIKKLSALLRKKIHYFTGTTRRVSKVVILLRLRSILCLGYSDRPSALNKLFLVVNVVISTP